MTDSKFILTKRLPEIASYISLLYYIEIIYMMLVIVSIFGKTVSLATGVTASLLLAYQIISLNMRKDFSIKVQLVIMELHFALSAVFIINLFMRDFTIYRHDILITAARLFLATVELPLIYLFTGEKKGQTNSFYSY
jgi:hypothetical protein